MGEDQAILQAHAEKEKACAKKASEQVVTESVASDDKDLTGGGKFPWRRKERRSKQFVERLSIILVIGAFVGGYIVLLDIKLTLTLWSQTVTMGGAPGFSQDAKGMVLQSMLISGFAAVVAFWLGMTKQGQEQAQTVSRMAESAAPTTAAAVAAATGAPANPIKTDDVKIDADTVSVDTKSKKKK